MSRFFLCLSFICLSVYALQAQQSPKLLDSLVNEYVKQNKFHGSVLVADKGKILLQKGYGWKDVAQKIKATENSLYQYGSVTKQFTAALIMHLQQKGRLNVNDKLSKYFPELPFADSITIYHLLTHTSGIYNYTNNEAFMQNDAVKPTTQQKIFALFQDKPLEFRPGSEYSYSNSGYMLLGYIIEKVSGKPYEQLMREVIFKPAGMHTAGFDFANLKSDDRATGYYFINSDKFQVASIVDSSVAYAAGSLYGSVKDLYAWHQAMQKNKILSDAYRKQVYTPYKDKYALGVIVDTAFGRPVVEHGGGIFGFTSMLKRFPEDDVVVIVLSNNSSHSSGEIANKLAALVFNQAVEWPKELIAVKLSKEQLEAVTGDYELMPNFILTISLEDNGLKVQATGQPKVDLYAENETSFFLKVVDAKLVMERDPSGKVTGLKLLQGGQTMPARKIK